MFRTLIFSAIVLSITALSGCGGQSRPADLPRLYPCTVTVLQDGRPLGEGIVKLVSTDPSFRWVIFAQLDSSGTGKVYTQGLYVGVPEGEYKVVVSKEESVSEQVGPTITRQDGDSGETITVTPTSVKVYTLVEKEYTDAKTTPLSITISQKGNNQTFDCGKPVREFLHNIDP